MRPNWACSKCGMPSSRRWNVQQHNKNQHGGLGIVVNYLEYEAGITSGRYKPHRGTDSEKVKGFAEGIKLSWDNVYRHASNHIERKMGEVFGDTIIKYCTASPTDTAAEIFFKSYFLGTYFTNNEHQDRERNEREERDKGVRGSDAKISTGRVDPSVEEELKKMTPEKKKILEQFVKLTNAKATPDELVLMWSGDEETRRKGMKSFERRVLGEEMDWTQDKK